MLKELDRILRQSLVVFDFIIISLSFFIAYELRALLETTDLNALFIEMYPMKDSLVLLPVIGLIWVGALRFVGAYRPFRIRDFSDVMMDIIKAVFFSTIVFAALAYLFKFYYINRSFIVLLLGTAWVFTSIERIIIILISRTLRKRGYNFRQVLVVGTGPRAQTFINLVKRHPEWGLRIEGLVDDDPDIVGNQVLGYPVLGTLTDIPQLFKKYVVDEIFFVVPRSWIADIEDIILYCEQVGKKVNIAVDFFRLKFATVKQGGLHDFPFLTFQTTPDALWPLVVKRGLDIFAATIAILLLLPFGTLIALIMKITTPGGAIFFKQKRSGLNGRTFIFYKFRTMVPDAEKQLDELKKFNEMEGPVFKMDQDPRITPLGKWMRKFSVDEWPQFFHVLMGDMSIVGPRPPLPSEVDKYKPWQRRRLSMRPGLTCIWQVSGRNNIVDFDEWMRMDLEYIDSWSLWLDCKLFFKTFPVVVFAVGAK